MKIGCFAKKTILKNPAAEIAEPEGASSAPHLFVGGCRARSSGVARNVERSPARETARFWS